MSGLVTDEAVVILAGRLNKHIKAEHARDRVRDTDAMERSICDTARIRQLEQRIADMDVVIRVLILQVKDLLNWRNERTGEL